MAQAIEAEKVGQVARQLAMMDRCLDWLVDAVTEVEARLEGILGSGNEEADGENEKQPSPRLVPVAEHISDHICKVNYVIAALDALRRRVEL